MRKNSGENKTIVKYTSTFTYCLILLSRFLWRKKCDSEHARQKVKGWWTHRVVVDDDDDDDDYDET